MQGAFFILFLIINLAIQGEKNDRLKENDRAVADQDYNYQKKNQNLVSMNKDSLPLIKECLKEGKLYGRKIKNSLDLVKLRKLKKDLIMIYNEIESKRHAILNNKYLKILFIFKKYLDDFLNLYDDYGDYEDYCEEDDYSLFEQFIFYLYKLSDFLTIFDCYICRLEYYSCKLDRIKSAAKEISSIFNNKNNKNNKSNRKISNQQKSQSDRPLKNQSKHLEQNLFAEFSLSDCYSNIHFNVKEFLKEFYSILNSYWTFILNRIKNLFSPDYESLAKG